MKINKISNINFKGPLDGALTNILRACDTNEMVNAVGLDIGAMVIPRTYYDTNARNKYAGAETFFREISGTFINCLSAGLLAQFLSGFLNKTVTPEIKLNNKSWFTNDSLKTLSKAWKISGNIKDFTETIFNNLSGKDGFNVNYFKNINWKKVEWIDEAKWKQIKWDNINYQNIQDKIKTKDNFIEVFTNIIKDSNITHSDRKNILSIMEKRLTNALGAGRYTKLRIGEQEFETTLANILRDSFDMGHDIFNNKKINPELAIKKFAKINRMKAFGAITGSCLLGLTNQYLNRKITEKRTGKKGFVGEIDFCDEFKKETKKDNFLWLKKTAASLLMAGMVFSVMGVKSFKEFAKKLEFSGPITSGNAIKTVYAANIIGRFIAADNGTELRESMTRDYLGFLNWLVFGGFAAKGVANLLDKEGKNLFNYHKKGKGIKHWLNDISLKTHNEIAAKGKDFAKKNMWKMNLAQGAGIAYSAITLGILLPMLNAKVTKYKCQKQN